MDDKQKAIVLHIAQSVRDFIQTASLPPGIVIGTSEDPPFIAMLEDLKRVADELRIDIGRLRDTDYVPLVDDVLKFCCLLGSHIECEEFLEAQRRRTRHSASARAAYFHYDKVTLERDPSGRSGHQCAICLEHISLADQERIKARQERRERQEEGQPTSADSEQKDEGEPIQDHFVRLWCSEGHVMHKSCIDHWITAQANSAKTCPICRGNLVRSVASDIVHPQQGAAYHDVHAIVSGQPTGDPATEIRQLRFQHGLRRIDIANLQAENRRLRMMLGNNRVEAAAGGGGGPSGETGGAAGEEARSPSVETLRNMRIQRSLDTSRSMVQGAALVLVPIMAGRLAGYDSREFGVGADALVLLGLICIARLVIDCYSLT